MCAVEATVQGHHRVQVHLARMRPHPDASLSVVDGLKEAFTRFYGECELCVGGDVLHIDRSTERWDVQRLGQVGWD